MSHSLWRCRHALLTLLLACLSAGSLAQTDDASEGVCDNRPVYMIVAGETLDVQRMAEYARTIRDTGIYGEVGGYYVNLPRPVAIFEGDVPKDYVSLIVRFPCLENARRFWYSRVYQETIKPIRLNPSAGDYTVTVYREGELPDYMQGGVGTAEYTKSFDASDVQQINRE